MDNGTINGFKSNIIARQPGEEMMSGISILTEILLGHALGQPGDIDKASNEGIMVNL